MAVGSVDAKDLFVEGGLPVGVSVEEPVVVATEQEPVRDAGFAAVFPVLVVMHIAPAGGDLTSGPLAAAVAGDDDSALRVGKCTLGAAHIEGFRVGSHDHA